MTELNETKSIAQVIFDKALQLKAGERLEVPFTSIGEMKSKKVMLFNEKKRYEQAKGETLNLFVSQNSKEMKLVISLSPVAVKCLVDMQIVSADGTAKSAVDVSEVQKVDYSADEKLRVAKVMREDGCSEEEIRETLEAM